MIAFHRIVHYTQMARVALPDLINYSMIILVLLISIANPISIYPPLQLKMIVLILRQAESHS